MAYNENTPASINESFSTSQPKITSNFKAIKATIEQDHEDFNGVDEGKHKQILFTQQGASTSTAADEMSFYTKDNAGSPNLYFRLESDGTEFNMTPSTDGHAATGHEVFPSGLVMNWGRIILGAGTLSGTLALSKSIAAIYSLTYGVTSSNASMKETTNAILSAYSIAGGTVTITRKHSNDPVVFNLLVIGK